MKWLKRLKCRFTRHDPETKDVVISACSPIIIHKEIVCKRCGEKAKMCDLCHCKMATHTHST